MAEKARQPVNFYESGEAAEQVQSAPIGFRGPGFKAAREETKIAVGTKIDKVLLKAARDFCHEKGITFASFVEVAFVDELEKQRKGGGQV